jgi:hypothetical protein
MRRIYDREVHIYFTSLEVPRTVDSLQGHYRFHKDARLLLYPETHVLRSASLGDFVFVRTCPYTNLDSTV